VARGSVKGRLPALEGLHHDHPGLTPSLARTYAEAASVCLDRHHQRPAHIEIVHSPEKTGEVYELLWTLPGSRERAAWANTADATRDGAYSLALASAQVELGLVAVSRAETLTGADYYLGEPGQTSAVDDLERAFRVEISGVDLGSRATIRQRLRRKANQLRRGDSSLPAFACVVGFQMGCVVLEKVEGAS
jgi:hypothetical protein